MKFLNALEPLDRPPILGEVRETLTRQWGPKYGWAILNQQVLESPDADALVRAIKAKPNALAEYMRDLPDRLEEARVKREDIALRRPVRRSGEAPLSGPAEVEAERVEPRDEGSAHTKTQSELVTLGRITGCAVWVAANDRGRAYDGKTFADQCLKRLPGMGLSDEATRRISLIDVIWIRQNAPVCAFEIEMSTSIYSGLLRMSDLLAVVPALHIQIYIVAPRERQDKVLTELSRPTFRKVGLNEYCRYIPSEDLSELIGKVKGLSGHVQTTILDTIAVPLEDEQDQDSP